MQFFIKYREKYKKFPPKGIGDDGLRTKILSTIDSYDGRNKHNSITGKIICGRVMKKAIYHSSIFCYIIQLILFTEILLTV